MLIGTLAGAAVGFLFFGPAGLFAGGAIGFLAVWLLSLALFKSRLGAIRAQYLEAVFAVMGALCKADGQVSKDEIDVAEHMFDQLRMNDDQRARARAAFRRGKQPDFDLDAEMDTAARACHGRRALQQMFLQVQIAAVAADKQLHPAEHEVLLRVTRGLGLPRGELDRIEAMLGIQQSGRGDALGNQTGHANGLEQAYALLELKADASDTEVRKAYRRLMSRNHPDKLAARGLPENMRTLAEEKTREIGAAYERIRAARGMV